MLASADTPLYICLLPFERGRLPAVGVDRRLRVEPKPVHLYLHGMLTMPECRRCHSITAGLVLVLLLGRAAADDWPQWRGPTRDGRWYERGIVTGFASPRLPLKWRVEVSSGYTSPTVADGRVFVSDRVTAPREQERVLCFDARTGAALWSHAYDCAYVKVSYPAGPRAAITLCDGRAYALGTMGHLLCLEARSGSILWQRDLHTEYRARVPIWGISAAPLVLDDLLIVQAGGAPDACVIAFDRVSGAERWHALPDRPSYSAPIVLEQAGHRVLVCWTGDRVVGLDPVTGAVGWDHPFPSPKMVIGIADPVVDRGRLLISDFFEGSLLLELAADRTAVSQVWRRKGQSERQTDSLHALIGTPFFEGDFIYGVDSYGELRCLNAGTGDRVWEDLSILPKTRWGTIHMVRNGDRVWMFSEKGMLIIAKLTPSGYREISRAKLIEPTREQHRRGVCWSHPAFADRCVFIRSDAELVCADLSTDGREASEGRSR